LVAKKGEPASERPRLTVPPAEAEELVASQIAAGEKVPNASINQNEEARQWYKYTVELLRQIFTTDEIRDEFTGKSSYNIGDVDISTGAYLKKLRSISQRLKLYPSIVASAGVANRNPAESPAPETVFLVHGHDEGAREAAARFMEHMGIETIILHERANSGRTIIEKLEAHSSVGFAVVLLTPDDLGRAREADAELRPRARQNVVLELGYFFGLLGRTRVCALHKGPLELPSDYLGVVYIDMDAGGAWRLLLARELRAAGFSIDLNRIP
jgi:predicted nucleotide-binding protein